MTASRTMYCYRVWRVGVNGVHWACRARGPYEWIQQYGFHSHKEAVSWGLDSIQQIAERDREKMWRHARDTATYLEERS